MIQTSPSPRHSGWLWPLMATVLVLSWSAAFIGMRFSADQAPAFLTQFWRMTIGGLLLLPIALWIAPLPSPRAMAEQALFGFLGMFLLLGGIAQAIAYTVPTGLVALIADLTPLAVAALSQPILGQPLTARQWLGTALGALGVLIVSADSLQLGDAPGFAYLLPVIGMLVFALVTVLQKRLGSINLPIIQGLCIQCLTAALCFLPCALWEGGLAPPQTTGFALGLAWMILNSTFFAYGFYYLCLRLYPAAQVGAVIYLSPAVTMLWAWAIFAEPLTATMLVGLAVTLAGVWLATARSGG